MRQAFHPSPRSASFARRLAVPALLAATALLSACGTMSSIFSSPEPQPGTASPFAVLQATVGNARCERDAQCHTVAVGHRACGGPERYLPWSDAVTDRARLQEAADAYAAERKKEEAGSGRMSTCQMLADPGARCDATSQRCVLTIGTGGGAAAR